MFVHDKISTNFMEKTFLQQLDTPEKIQKYLESIPFNHEEGGETCRSAYQVIRNKKAHCLEGAFLACAALQTQKRRPLIISLKVTDNDYDHVITIFKENGHFGAISKTNHAVLGWRDPVYKTIRELAMSYFHEYFLVRNGEKTLRGYSRLINLNRFGSSWITSGENQLAIAEAISDVQHVSVIPHGNEQFIRRATTLERSSASISRDGN
jgi:hypothetical protein